MRHYELVTILSPMLNQEEAAETWNRIKEFITVRNGEITDDQVWGTRRLAYPIRKGSHDFLEGTYHATRFSVEKPINQELEAFLRFDDRILRSLVVVADPKTVLTQPTTATGRWGGRGPGPGGAPPYRGGQQQPAQPAAPAAEAPAAAEEAPAESPPAAEAAPETAEAPPPEEPPTAEAPAEAGAGESPPAPEPETAEQAEGAAAEEDEEKDSGS